MVGKWCEDGPDYDEDQIELADIAEVLFMDAEKEADEKFDLGPYEEED